MESDCELWKEYLQNRDKILSILSRLKFADEDINNLAGLHKNVQKITHALNDINNQSSELELHNEKSNEIIKRADNKSKDKFKKEMKDLNDEWKNTINDLEKRRDTLNNLAQNWERLETQIQNFESFLTKANEKVKLLDVAVRSKSQEDEARNTLTVSSL